MQMGNQEAVEISHACNDFLDEVRELAKVVSLSTVEFMPTQT
jgi:hypothetical protein